MAAALAPMIRPYVSSRSLVAVGLDQRTKLIDSLAYEPLNVRHHRDGDLLLEATELSLLCQPWPVSPWSLIDDLRCAPSHCIRLVASRDGPSRRRWQEILTQGKEKMIWIGVKKP